MESDRKPLLMSGVAWTLGHSLGTGQGVIGAWEEPASAVLTLQAWPYSQHVFEGPGA